MSSIKSGKAAFNHATSTFSAAKKTYDAEIASGHFNRGKSVFLWMQGESDFSTDAQTYGQGLITFLNKMKSELAFEYTGIILARAMNNNDLSADQRSLILTGARNFQGYISRQINGT